MQKSENKKSHIKKSETSLRRRKKFGCNNSDTIGQIKPDDQKSKQEERYKTLVENIPCAVYSAFPGETGLTTFMSKNWKDWTGYSAEELYQDPEAWPKCIHPDDREKTVNAYIEACVNKAPYSLVYRIVHRDTGQVRHVRDQGLLSKDKKGDIIKVDGIITDISELTRAENELVKYRDHLEELVRERTAELARANEVLELQEKESQKAVEALRESENRYKAVIDNAQEGIVVVQDKTLKFANPQVMIIMGYTEEELKSLPFIEFIHPDDREMVMGIHLRRFKGEEIPEVYEVRIIDKQGNTKWLENNGVMIEWGGRPATLNFIRDITERKKAEQQLLDYQAKLKSLASQLSVIEERERRRIATELHDQIGQSLVFSKTKLDSMRDSMSSGELNDSLGEVCDCLGQVIRDTRTLTFDLSYPILYELGFEAAVSEWLNEQIESNYGIKTEFEDDGRPKPLDEDICALLFRNIRELLINVVKHANAQNVKVSICKVDKQICVSVEDDGVGLKPAEVTSLAGENSGFGIFSIRERLEQLGGRLEIDSEEGRGSKITMTAPLKLTKSQK